MSVIISFIKMCAIALADKITDWVEPYEDFDRPADIKDHQPLHEKARQFEQLIRDNFLILDGRIVTYKLPYPKASAAPFDLGDQSLWHGMATYAQALFHRLEPTEENGKILLDYLDGMDAEQPNDILARGVNYGQETRWDVSNDQATGHLLGLWGAYRYGRNEHGFKARTLMMRWMSKVIEAGYALTNPNGEVTEFGQLDAGWKTDPVRISLLLAMLLTAHAMTEDQAYIEHYDDLKAKYGWLLEFPKARFLWLDTHYDTHRVAIHLAILRHEHPQEKRYGRALGRLMDLARKQGNAWILALAGSEIGFKESDRELVMKCLSEFSVADKSYNTGRHLSTDPTIPQTHWPPAFLHGQPVAYQPVAKWKKTSRDFSYQDHPYSLDSRGDGEAPDSMFTGVDFNVAWRQSLVSGLLSPND